MDKEYISGPITGMRDLNRVAFSVAEAVIARRGFIPVNPHSVPCADHTWSGYMRADIAELVKCRRIYMLLG